MSVKVSIAQSSQLIAVSRIDLLVKRLEPFIREVATGIEKSGALSDTVAEAAQNHPETAAYFHIDPDTIESSFRLKTPYLFPESHTIETIKFINRKTNKKTSLKIAHEAVLPEIHNLLYLCSSGKFSVREIHSQLQDPWDNLFDNIHARGIVANQPRAKLDFPPASIYRLQHASLLYLSQTTGILVDPHLHSAYEPLLKDNIWRFDLEGKVNCILISHSHLDHWSLSTLMMFNKTTPIVVPKVPQASILCDNLQQTLQQVGFENVIAVDWYSSPIVIADVEISVLPFYGEQPLVYEQPFHPHLRNWGNTYVIKTEDYTSWFLIDSGNDAQGKMAEVATYVKEKFGQIDFLLSNLRIFTPHNPFYITGGHYWLSLSAQQMKKFPQMQHHQLTLGAKGVAEIAQIVNARYYLPYAHWWSELSTTTEAEKLELLQLQMALQEMNCSTEIVPWSVGDGFQNGEIKVKLR